jgi:hypothetical protein
MRPAGLGFVSAGGIETARDMRTRFGAINQGGVTTFRYPSSEECRTELTHVGCRNPPRTQHKGRRAAEIVPNQRISVTPTSPNAVTTEPSSTGGRRSPLPGNQLPKQAT